MVDAAENNKRIAKNTLLLYFRMLFMMVVSLFTSRVVLNTLGVQDYGIQNVVGGVVVMFSILSGSLSSAISRFITFELGRGNIQRLKVIFSTAVSVQALMALIIIMIAEGVGVWFLNYKMNIPIERLDAANWVLQCSILTFAINLISIPYNAAIIAHEKMSAFAYISILEVTMKLLVVYSLYVLPFDKLKTYAVLLLILAVVIRIVYGIYSKRNFEECTYHFIYDKNLLKEMSSFAGWNLIGNGAFLLNTQGVNILSNVFFGVTVNAARGVATQVDAAITQFVNNFTTAINPQITKSFAAGDCAYMHQLVCRGAKYSFFMMFMFTVPFVLETNTILTLWLKNVPEYASVFLRLTIASSLCTVLSNTLVTSMFATGKIKKYQITVGIIGSLVFPFSWIFFSLGFPPQTAYVVYFFIYAILLFVRLYLLHDMVGLSMMKYVREVLFKIFPVIVLAFIIPGVICYLQPPSVLRLIEVCITSGICTMMLIYAFGLDKDEKTFVISKMKFFIKKKFK